MGVADDKVAGPTDEDLQPCVIEVDDALLHRIHRGAPRLGLMRHPVSVHPA
jgi:hypothetical protein